MLRVITPDQLWNKIQLLEKPLLLDISPIASFDRGYIRGSIHVPSDHWREDGEVDRYLSSPGGDVILVTETGMIDAAFLSQVISRLEGAGCLSFYWLEGGKARWREESHTLQSVGYPPPTPFAPTLPKNPIPSEKAAAIQQREVRGA